MDVVDALRGLEPVQARHCDVHENDIRLQIAHQTQRLAAITSLRHYLHLRQVRNQRGEPGPHQGVVISDEDAHARLLPCFLVESSYQRPCSVSETCILVPLPGADSNMISPPANLTRSCMPTTPRLLPDSACLRAATASKPRPSSSTTSVSTPSACWMRAINCFAPEWRSTLDRAS